RAGQHPAPRLRAGHARLDARLRSGSAHALPSSRSDDGRWLRRPHPRPAHARSRSRSRAGADQTCSLRCRRVEHRRSRRRPRARGDLHSRSADRSAGGRRRAVRTGEALGRGRACCGADQETATGMKRAALAAAAAAALALAACAKTSTAVAPRTGSGNAWTAHGTVRLTESEEPNSLIRMFSNQASADDVTALLFEPFFRFDDHERPVPALVTVFPTQKNGLISADGLRITYKLRPSVLWSDGVPVTADDVIFTWHAIVDGKNPVAYTQGYDQIKTIVADNPHQVTFVMKKPQGAAVYLFSEGTFMPLPKHLLDKFATLNNIGYDTAPVGDGPFVLKQWLRGSDLIFGPNTNYWRGRPKLDAIDIKIIPN